MSESGFGTYGHFTERVSYEDDRVRAQLKTVEPQVQGDVTYRFDLSFDLPVSMSESG